MPYVLQHPDFALGNFINLTPAIRWLAERDGQPVPVYFSTGYVQECFMDCPFIRILDRKSDQGPLFDSGMINPENDMPDYQYVFQRIAGKKWTPEYHTYVDGFDFEYDKSITMINGSGSADARYVSKKDIGESPYSCIKNIVSQKGFELVACGSYQDMERAPYMARLCDRGVWGNIRQTLSQLSRTYCVIANDTGLAHAAGAMHKPLLVLWKNTPRERCKNAGSITEYSYENHEENIQRFLEKYL